jgi:hypothetical protein
MFKKANPKDKENYPDKKEDEKERNSFYGSETIEDFRRKYNLSSKTRIFILNGGYPAIRKALLKRGKNFFIFFLIFVSTI